MDFALVVSCLLTFDSILPVVLGVSSSSFPKLIIKELIFYDLWEEPRKTWRGLVKNFHVPWIGSFLPFFKITFLSCWFLLFISTSLLLRATNLGEIAEKSIFALCRTSSSSGMAVNFLEARPFSFNLKLALHCSYPNEFRGDAIFKY